MQLRSVNMARKAYPSDISNAEWQIIEPLLPEAQCIGCPREVDFQEILKGIFYVLHKGYDELIQRALLNGGMRFYN